MEAGGGALRPALRDPRPLVSSGVRPAPYQAWPGSQALICAGPASSVAARRGVRGRKLSRQGRGEGGLAWRRSLSLEGPTPLRWPLGSREEARPTPLPGQGGWLPAAWTTEAGQEWGCRAWPEAELHLALKGRAGTHQAAGPALG